MVAIATQLLPKDAISPSAENHYLLTVAILAHLALKQNALATELWRRYDFSEPPIELRWLAAVAINSK
jgi:hypothetical protein